MNYCKRIFGILLLCLFVHISMAQDPPPPPDPYGGGQNGGPVGGGAPIGEGLFILLLSGVAYGVKKNFRKRSTMDWKSISK